MYRFDSIKFLFILAIINKWFCFFSLYLDIYRVAKVTLPKKNLNISITARANELLFFINDRGMFKLYIYKDISRDTPC